MMIMRTSWLCLNSRAARRCGHHAYFLAPDGQVAVGRWAEREGRVLTPGGAGLLRLDSGRAALLDLEGFRVPVAGGGWVVDRVAAADWLLTILRTAGVGVQCDQSLGSFAGAVADAMRMLGGDPTGDLLCASLTAVDAHEATKGLSGQDKQRHIGAASHVFHDRDDGLHHCKRCGGAEASLTTECPGFMMSDEVESAVQNLGLDFADGRWLWRNLVRKESTLNVTTILGADGRIGQPSN